MARYNGGIMGNVSGRLGNTVSSKKDGKNIIKSRNRSYNKQPTAAQAARRSKYNRAVNFWRQFPESFKKLTINQWDTKLPIYQEFMKRNMDCFGSHYQLHTGIDIAHGPVSRSPFQYFAKEVNGNTTTFSFDPIACSDSNCQDEDEVYIWGSIAGHSTYYFPDHGIQRRDWGLDFTLFYPDPAPANYSYIYYFWHRPSTGENSEVTRIISKAHEDTYYSESWL